MARKCTGQPNGRPKKKIEMTPEMVITAMGMCQCTKVEVCAKLGITKNTFDAREGFSSLYIDGKLLGKSRLRQKLVNTALEGNAQVLIHLSKSMLGNKESSGLELSGPDGSPIQVDTSNARERLATLVARSAERDGPGPIPAVTH